MSSADSLTERTPIEMPKVRTHLFDPPSVLAELREREPVCRLQYPDGHVGWLVTSHRLGSTVLTDSRFGRPRIEGLPFGRLPLGDPVKWAEFTDAWEKSGALVANPLRFDPPEHTRLRRVLSGQFTLRRVAEHRARIEQIVANELDAMEEAGPPADLLKVFATPVSLATHCAILGVPEREGERFAGLTQSALDPRISLDETMAAYGEFIDFVQTVIEHKRREPGDDLASYVISSGELTDEEIFSTIFTLFQAGHEPTASTLALGTFALLCHPDQLEALRADPSLIDAAVEEVFRYVPVFQIAGSRTALEDVELDGVLIKAGEDVTVSLAAANRDPEKFDHPDEFDIVRSGRGHLAFGHGIHMCVGQHLGRLELQVALAELLRRFPALRLAVPADQVPVNGGEQITYGVQELPITW